MYVEELDLEQLLADPLIRLVMASDAVGEGDIRRLADATRIRRRAATPDLPGLSALAAQPLAPVCGWVCEGRA